MTLPATPFDPTQVTGFPVCPFSKATNSDLKARMREFRSRSAPKLPLNIPAANSSAGVPVNGHCLCFALPEKDDDAILPTLEPLVAQADTPNINRREMVDLRNFANLFSAAVNNY